MMMVTKKDENDNNTINTHAQWFVLDTEKEFFFFTFQNSLLNARNKNIITNIVIIVIVNVILMIILNLILYHRYRVLRLDHWVSCGSRSNTHTVHRLNTSSFSSHFPEVVK